jgi:hypothetical protein
VPIYHHFYVERREPEGWVVPGDFAPDPGMAFECDRRFGAFAFVHPRRGWPDLFFGAHRIFPMRPGPPDDRRGSPLFQHLDLFYDYDRDEDQLGWIPYPELLIDCWDTESVTVAGSVPARRAPLFEDGTRPFPRAALRSAGATDRELERLADARPVREPLDVAFGRERHRIAELPPDELVQVTWRATVAELIGEPYVALFKGLRRYGPDEELRILHKRG